MPLPRSRARKTAKKAAKRAPGRAVPAGGKTLRKGERETLRKKKSAAPPKSTKGARGGKKPVSKSSSLKGVKAAAPVWTPDQVLPDGQHELFAQRVALCCYSNTSCYMQAYGDDLKGDTARTNASRLLANANVAARVEHLKREGAKNAEAEVGEVIRLCLNIMRTPVGYVDEESPLAQEVQRDIAGSEEEGTIMKVKVKIPGKLEAAKLLTEIKGWKKPQEVDLNVNYMRPEEALQKAMGAGVDVKALLGKLLGPSSALRATEGKGK